MLDNNLDNWLDFSGLMPPLSKDLNKKIEKDIQVNLGGKHTFLAFLGGVLTLP